MTHERHILDEASIKAAVEEVVMRDHLVASSSWEGDYKKLYFNPGTSTYRLRTRDTEWTCKTAAEAARIYSEK